MRREAFILLLTLMVGPLFLVIPDYQDGRPIDFFLFSDQKLTFQTWLYFLSEHLTVCLLAWLIKANVKGAIWPLIACYFWLEIADTVDYLLTYNSVWFHVASIPISMNVVKVLIFVTYAIRYGRVDIH